MSSNFERSQLTKIMISSAPVTAGTLDSASYLGLSCTIKEVQFTAGQKQDTDVTTLCSAKQENANGLGTVSEISMSDNFYLDATQSALHNAYDNDATYGFRVIFSLDDGFTFMAEVRQRTRSAETSGVVATMSSLRLKGKPVLATGSLKVKVGSKNTLRVVSRAKLETMVETVGSIPPYSYAWKKGGSPVSGQMAVTFSKVLTTSGDAGAYTCEISDSTSLVSKMTSTSYTVAVS